MHLVFSFSLSSSLQIFGSELACLDGSVGGSGSIGAQGGAGGGQILIKAFSLVLDGAITADGTAAPVASGGAQVSHPHLVLP